MLTRLFDCFTAGGRIAPTGLDSIGLATLVPVPRWSTNATEGAVVSYRLAKHRVVAAVERGKRQPHEVCDAQPELRRVAHHHSVAIDEPCPICDGDELVAVTFAFGPGLPKSGRCVADRAELQKLRRRGKPTTCYLIEVCRQCWWNHMRESFELSSSGVAAS